MVRKVQVPMDFGLKYLGSPSHSNLTFRLGSGEDILANSVIISYNSPVIDRLTTDDSLTTIDVDDFAKEAVQCFVEASYSGELKKVSKPNFRDVNKMAHIFEVSWMVDRCFGYFDSLANEVTGEEYADLLYLFEEAMFMLMTIKKRNFVEVVVKRFSTLHCNTLFVTRYLNSDLSVCSTKHLDVIIELTERQRCTLMEALIRHLEINVINNKTGLDSNSRYLLENGSLTAYVGTHQTLFQRFFSNLEAIENPSKSDFNLVVRLLKQFEKSLSLQKNATIPNLFHSFDAINGINDFDALIDFLVESPLVTSSYIFFDGVFSWLFNKRTEKYTSPAVIQGNFTEKYSAAMSKQGWAPIAKEYINSVQSSVTIIKTLGLIDKMILTEGLTTEDGYHRIACWWEYSPDEFFSSDHYIKFHFRHPSTTSCNRIGDCGFILHISSSGSDDLEDSFNIQPVIDPDLYPADIHFHSDCLSFVSMHFALDLIDDDPEGNCFNFPVTWYGKPIRNDSRKYWIWGAHRFYKLGECSISTPGYGWWWNWGANKKIRPVVYMSDPRWNT